MPAAFDYPFHALEEKDNVLRQAFGKVAYVLKPRTSRVSLIIPSSYSGL